MTPEILTMYEWNANYLNSYCIIIFLIVFFFDDIMLVELSFLIYIFLIVGNIIIQIFC